MSDRLNQGPFPQYPPDALIPTDDVVMTTTPSVEVVPNYGKGLVTYITADSGTDGDQVGQYSAGHRRAGTNTPGGSYISVRRGGKYSRGLAAWSSPIT